MGSDLPIELRARSVDQGPDSKTPSLGPDAASVEKQITTRRLFSGAQLFAFSLAYMGTWEGWTINIYSGLLNGGPRAIFCGSFLAVAGAIAQAGSISEMASLQPVAGAQYHWTFHLAPRGFNRLMCYVQGWATWFGYVSLLASIANGAIIQLEALIEFNNPDYTAKGWHTTLMVMAICVQQGFMNMYTFKIVPWLELLCGVLHVALWVVWVIIMGVMGTRHNKEFLLVDSSSSGWNNSFVSWNLGMTCLTWSLTGFDSAIHMSEETRKAKSAVPRAIFWSITTNGFLALGFMAAFLIAMGDIDTVMGATSALLSVTYNTTKSKSATTALMCLFWFTSYCGNLAIIASVSRLTWAWARDGGLPRYFTYIHPKHHVPVRAVVLTVTLACLLCLLNIGSTTYIVFNAITSLCCWAIYLSYAICISSLIYARVVNPNLKLGDWNLGRAGLYVNIFALVYTLWVMVILPFPSTVPVTPSNMNYCGPIVIVILLFIAVMWFGWARKNWPGPNLTIRDFILAHS